MAMTTNSSTKVNARRCDMLIPHARSCAAANVSKYGRKRAEEMKRTSTMDRLAKPRWSAAAVEGSDGAARGRNGRARGQNGNLLDGQRPGRFYRERGEQEVAAGGTAGLGSMI